VCRAGHRDPLDFGVDRLLAIEANADELWMNLPATRSTIRVSGNGLSGSWAWTDWTGARIATANSQRVAQRFMDYLLSKRQCD
jgi:hypothetical protein